MKSEIYFIDKIIGKMTKKLRDKQKFWYPDNVMTKMMPLSRLLKMISIALELNK